MSCRVPANRSSWLLCNFGNHGPSLSSVPLPDPPPATKGEDGNMQWELVSSVLLDSRWRLWCSVSGWSPGSGFCASGETQR
ncbi:Uncharacterised protein [Chlamydia abortus]|nr:Uncharacterised protein [Chlamydia abortus]